MPRSALRARRHPHPRAGALPGVLLACLAPAAASAGGLLDNSITWFDGEQTQDQAGSRVARAGDVDGDGFADYLVASRGFDSDTGKVYLFPGASHGWPLPLTRATALAVMTGQHDLDQFGEAMTGAGDVNGDGLADVLISALAWYPQEGNTAGGTGLFLGRPRGETWPASLTSADAFFVGQENSQSGRAVAGLGDVDGDGYDDFAVGSGYADGPGTNEGAAYVFYGGATVEGGSLEDAPTIVRGAADNDNLGFGVQGVGDVDGDGYPDLAVGAPGNDDAGSKAGAVFLFRGGARWGATLTPDDAFAVIRGDEANREAAHQFAGPGDFDGDGYGDLAIGDRHPEMADLGVAAWIFRGGPSGRLAAGGEFLLSEADARVGMPGTDSGLGTPLDWLGDLDGDGRDELVLGFKEYLELQGGAVIGYGADFAGEQVEAITDVYDGERCQTSWCGDFAGHSVAGPGDIDGDGVPDLLAGAPDRDDETTNGGRAYIVAFGPARDDDDGDGVSEHRGDCDDTDPAVTPEATEDGCDSLDNDCDGAVDEDCDPPGDDDTTPPGDDDDSAAGDPPPETACGSCSAAGRGSSGTLPPALAAALIAGLRRRRAQVRPAP